MKKGDRNMDFELSEEQKLLKTSARDFLSQEFPPSLAKEMLEDKRGYPPELWGKIAELGWLGLVLPEKYGGSSMNFLDLAILLEEMGTAYFLGPFVPTVLTSMAIMENGSDEQKEYFLPKIISGEMVLTFAFIEPEVRYDEGGVQAKATASDSDYLITGTKSFVSNANAADYILVAARNSDKGVTLFLVDAKSPGVKINPLTIESGDKQSEVKLEGVQVPAKNILGEPNEGWPIAERIMQRAIVARCAEMVGGASRVIEMSVNYAKERQQFGRPIGSFQAIQHHCANMVIDADGMRVITYQSAWMLDEGIPCTKEISMAKAWASTVYPKIAVLGHQVHGAIAYTSDYDMYLYFMQAMAGDVYMGDADYHYTLVGREILK